MKILHSDGNAQFVADLPRTSEPIPAPFNVWSAQQPLLAMDDAIYFIMDDDVHGDELWNFDETNGFTLARDIRPGPAGSNPELLAKTSDAIFFTANDGQHGQEIWSITNDGPASVPGDTNGDLDVDFEDFLVLSANFGKETNIGAADGDFDEDGRVTFTDFLLLSKNFGT